MSGYNPLDEIRAQLHGALPDRSAVAQDPRTEPLKEKEALEARMKKQSFPTAISLDPEVSGPGQISQEGAKTGMRVLSEFTPGSVSVGDALDIGGAVKDPSLMNVAIAGAGLIPLAGTPLKKGLKAVKGAVKTADAAGLLVKRKELLAEWLRVRNDMDGLYKHEVKGGVARIPEESKKLWEKLMRQEDALHQDIKSIDLQMAEKR